MSNRNSAVDIKRREYNQFVATETIEDYALRYSPASFRNWSEFLVANTAIGSISFLALEAIGASIAIKYGFQNAFWGILTASIIIFLMGFPICYQAAKHNIDIDLLTRATGFGYLGSTITSLIYASFCFIFFALEAAIMAQALLLYTGIPLFIGYAISSVIIIPLVFYGMTMINRLQLYTQPVWLILMILPFVMVLKKEPQLLEQFFNLAGSETGSSEFSFYHFGFAIGISLALIAQIGEQVDYLRFMPDKTKNNRFKWWAAVILAGPGWVILGFLKQLGGILLSALVLLGGASVIEAREPIYMYNAAYQYVFENPSTALSISFVFVIISQIKINVTNAYAGSLAWSNFFSRITHSHPGRVVWLIFNIVIALLIMELGVFGVLENILGLYSNIAVAWIAAMVADITINKPFGLSPKLTEFKRAHLYNINPVGVFSTVLASIFSIVAFSGFFGPELQAFSSIIALATAFVLSPIIALLTKGKYYIARQSPAFELNETHQCGVCNNQYHANDMAACSMYQNNICSLCCSLEGRCHDRCKQKKEFSLRDKLLEYSYPIINNYFQRRIIKKVISFILVFGALSTLIGFVLWTTYTVRTEHIDNMVIGAVRDTYINLFYILMLVSLVTAWLIVLVHEGREFVEQELTHINDALNISESNLAHAQQVARLGSWVLDIEKNKLHWSDEVFRIFEIDSEKFEATHEIFQQAIHPEDREMVNKAYQSSTAHRTPYDIEYRLLLKNGRIKYVNEKGETKHDKKGNPIESSGTVLDITELKKAQALIQYQAHFDNLTNLPNRFLSLDRLSQLLFEAKRSEKLVAVLFLDLDDFKKINDTLGHDMGDKLLIETANRLGRLVRDRDTVGRLGGDEFLVLLGNLTNPTDAQTVAENIIDELRKVFRIEGRELIITASIGIAVYPTDGENARTLLKNSDSAMYHAKDMGRNSYYFFTDEMNREVSRRLALEEQIIGALERNEFEVFYQPKLEIKTGKIMGAEALLRWNNHNLGQINPVEFIPIAEHSGLIVPIGKFVLNEALCQTSQWQKTYDKKFQIAVNLSPRQFRDPRLVNNIENMMSNLDFDNQFLELEITEGVLMSGHNYIDKALTALSKLGISLAMDDFGTGYSSLSYLRTYPFSVVKIDREFVRDITTDNADKKLISAAIAMAHALNLKVVAEGVETEGQMDYLRQLNCDFAQGYLFSKPLPADKFEKLLQPF